MSSLRICLFALSLAFAASAAKAEGPSPLAADKLGHNDYVEPTRVEKF